MNISTNKKISGLKWNDYKTEGKIIKWKLRCYCYVGEKIFNFMTTILGEIRIKNDGRYEWFLIPSQYAPKEWFIKIHKQGVVKTLEEAKNIIESQLIL